MKVEELLRHRQAQMTDYMRFAVPIQARIDAKEVSHLEVNQQPLSRTFIYLRYARRLLLAIIDNSTDLAVYKVRLANTFNFLYESCSRFI